MKKFMKLIWIYAKHTSEELNVILRFPSWLAWTIAVSCIPANIVMFGSIQIWLNIVDSDSRKQWNEMVIDGLEED